MRIWIDADAAPRDVKEIVFRAGKRLGIAVVLVANQRMALPANDPNVSAVWVKGGPDEADKHIVDHADPGDVAITQDIPLAAALVGKGVHVLAAGAHGLTHAPEAIAGAVDVAGEAAAGIFEVIAGILGDLFG